MTSRISTRSISALLSSTLALALAASLGCSKPEFEGAQAEVKPHNIKLDLPAVPTFVLPNANPDGTHPVNEMRLRGKSYLGKEVRVKGFVLKIYDCATALRTPDMSEDDVKKKIDEDPTVCKRPNFYIGTVANAPIDKGVRVVENPRPPRKDEIKADPDGSKLAQEAFDAVPAFKVGDEVIVTGQWATVSPRRFRDSDGLLVFASLENLTTPAAPETP